MNKLAFLSCLSAAFLAFNSDAFAKDNMGGGFTGPGTDVSVITIEQAKGLNDDAIVILRGNIQKKIGNEMYLFTDGTGSINIEVDDDDWMGQNIGPDDLVEIKGEVDKGWTKIEIDVDQIQKVSK